MSASSSVHLDDTAVAFSYKSDRALAKANLIFTIVNNPTTSAIATRLAKAGLALHLPIKGIIRATVFDHFCGGETIDDCHNTIETLYRFRVGTILDYSVEGEHTEAAFDETTKEIIRTIHAANGQAAIPFSVFKTTGIASIDLLEKVQAGTSLTAEEQTAWKKVQERVDLICKTAHDLQVPVLIDAEDSWIQNPIDELAYVMMQRYNQERPIVFNTYQMYRADMLGNLQEAVKMARAQRYFLGAKLVRGAYMEKEAERAAAQGYPNPIHPSKEATDKAFNDALGVCIDNLDIMAVVCGSHNEYSNLYLTTLMEAKGIAPNDRRVWFAQLLGMSDNISFNIAKSGYNVVKYVPYGPVEAVMPYLLRRAAENTSVAGQSSRELTMIRRERRRRKSS